MKLYYDNKATTNIAHNSMHHNRTKHVEIDWHFIKEEIEKKLLCVVYLSVAHKQLSVCCLVVYCSTDN